MKKRLLFLITTLFALLWALPAQASHFRYGTISWRVPNPVVAPLTVEFTVQQAWRTSFLDCYNLSFGDGTTGTGCLTVQNVGTGTDSTGQQYTVREYVVTKTYASAGSFLAFFENCCRISTLQNGADATFRVETLVNLAAGNTGGPVSGSPPIRQMQIGAPRTLFFPVFDPDADAVTCRLATNAEAGFTPSTPSIPNGGAQPVVTTVPGGCQVAWDVTNALANQQYVVHIVAESTHGGALSSTQVDLIVEMITPPPPACAGGGTFVVDPGDTLTVPMTGTHNLATNLTLGAQNVPLGATLTPAAGTSAASPFNTTFNWTPTLLQAGTTNIVVVNYTNNLNHTGTCFLTIQVPQCADFGDPCSVGVGACQANGTNVCAGIGITTCSAVPGVPSPETCDGIDNDCNGTADNAPVDAGQPCTSASPGVCAAGLTVCGGGNLSCVPIIAPGSQMESCNTLDDDCDGSPDEDFNLGSQCSAGVGECQETGVLVCNALGGASCDAVPGLPSLETCDGLDNDCDGTADNGNPGGGLACSTGLPGVCAVGITACDSAAVVCETVTAPGDLAEVCDDANDSDCDGLPSNGCNGDTDGDGLPDDEEEMIGTDPNDADSDDDGIIDGLEPEYDTDSDGDGLINALDPDSDNDGLYDGTEVGNDCDGPGTDASLGHCIPDGDGGATVTDPLDADTDDGGVSDGGEDVNLNGVVDAGETDPTTGNGDDDIIEDSDGDGLTDDLEIFIGTDPNDADSDDDGIRDGDEPNFADDTDGDGVINALDPDSDDDGLFDGTEVGNDCDDPATDVGAGNCIPDGDDGATTTSPLDPDTDDGGVSDGDEDTNHDGVIDAGETDPNDGSDDFPTPPECEEDADCGGPNSGVVCDDETNTCVDGCRGENGNGCPEDERCTSEDETIGECVPEVECETDADCGGSSSGRVCDDETSTCVDGCRGEGGNGCPDGETCTSDDDTIGTCEEEEEPAFSVYAEGNGIFCASSPRGSNDPSGSLVVMGLLGLAGLVRARRSARKARAKGKNAA